MGAVRHLGVLAALCIGAVLLLSGTTQAQSGNGALQGMSKRDIFTTPAVPWYRRILVGVSSQPASPTPVMDRRRKKPQKVKPLKKPKAPKLKKRKSPKKPRSPKKPKAPKRKSPPSKQLPPQKKSPPGRKSPPGKKSPPGPKRPYYGKPRAYSDGQPPPPKACYGMLVTIVVRTEADFAARLKYPPGRKVKILVANNIILTKPLDLNVSFSCTWITSMLKSRPSTISGFFSSSPPIIAHGVANLLLEFIDMATTDPPKGKGKYLTCGDYRVLAPHLGMPGFRFEGGFNWCPVLRVWNAWNVWYINSNVRGRIDAFHVDNVWFDHLKVTVTENAFAGIQIGSVGDLNDLKMANVWVTNNRIYCNQALNGVAIDWYGQGVVVSNNWIYGFYEYGIRCGYGVSGSHHCAMNKFTHNWLENNPSILRNDTVNSGIYYNSHWTGAGNYASCNWIMHTKRCYFLDIGCVGIMIDGSVCYNSTVSTMTINNGHGNCIKSINLVHARYLEVLNTQLWLEQFCGKYMGNEWAKAMKFLAGIPKVKQAFPWFSRNWCDRKEFNNIPCHTPGIDPVTKKRYWTPAETGNCSGVMHGNYVEYSVVDNIYPTSLWMFHRSELIPAVTKMNTVKTFAIPRSTLRRVSPWRYDVSPAQFTNYAALDLTFKPTAPVWKTFPNFKQCPKAAVGPRPYTFYTHFKKWGTPQAPLIDYKDPPGMRGFCGYPGVTW